MALSERTVVDLIEILENGIVQVREATIVERDGKEIARSFHRWLLEPGEDTSEESARVQAIASAVWTSEVVAAYAAKTAPKDVTPASP